MRIEEALGRRRAAGSRADCGQRNTGMARSEDPGLRPGLALLACAFSIQFLAAAVTGSDVSVSPSPADETTSAALVAQSSPVLTGSPTPEAQTVVQHVPRLKDLLNASTAPSTSAWPTPGEPQTPMGGLQARSVEGQAHGEEQDSGARISAVDWELGTNGSQSASELLGTSPRPIEEPADCPGCRKTEGISEEEPLTLANPSNSLGLIKGVEGSGETFGLMRGTTMLKGNQDAKLVSFEEATDLPAQGMEGSTDYAQVDLEMHLWSELSTIPAHLPLTTSEPSDLPTDYDATVGTSDKFATLEDPDVSITSFNMDSTKEFLPGLPALTPSPDGGVSGVELATLHFWDEMASEKELRLTTVSPKVQTMLVRKEDVTRQTASNLDFISESYLTVFTDTSDSETRPDISLSPLFFGEGRMECQLGYLKQNKSCKSICDMAPNYCFNGGQCYVMENVGAICRCNAQDYIWHKGIRCEFIITEFQVMCIAIGSTAAVMLLLFMLTVFFAKKVYSLKTENKKLRKRSKYRPQLEQHNDNFSLSTIAEGSQANDDVNGQNKIHESVKTCPKDDESLNVQNNWTPKHDNKDSANAEVNSLQNNMI
ncbi:uncharacterized protein LOC129714869 [Leucoraja erinacea]|uniref:uncharacterized protein LOC129714869 n=1 Tax=Leucoraja erinaceus TaxID=7782 RepID=UPI002455DE01|nr:uncharacterized protein LOC129714869 [Leucoraja erinacea]